MAQLIVFAAARAQELALRGKECLAAYVAYLDTISAAWEHIRAIHARRNRDRAYMSEVLIFALR